MSDWVGTGSAVAGSGVATGISCIEYLTIAQLRAEFGEDIDDVTDIVLQRRIDEMAAYLEDQLGHTFGRALIATSTGAESVAVSATALTIGGDAYLFATYPTLQQLMAAVNGAGESYVLELLPNMRGNTPSTLLKLLSATACGPDYDDRVSLCVSAMYVLISGECKTHVFLPLNLASVTEVIENGVVLTTDDYYALPGDSWLIRKACSCGSVICGHPLGLWPSTYPGNIGVTFIPALWGRAPSALSALMVDAFRTRQGLTAVQSESFGDYRYTRATPRAATWQETLGAGNLRKYQVKFHP